LIFILFIIKSSR